MGAKWGRQSRALSVVVLLGCSGCVRSAELSSRSTPEGEKSIYQSHGFDGETVTRAAEAFLGTIAVQNQLHKLTQQRASHLEPGEERLAFQQAVLEQSAELMGLKLLSPARHVAEIKPFLVQDQVLLLPDYLKMTKKLILLRLSNSGLRQSAEDHLYFDHEEEVELKLRWFPRHSVHAQVLSVYEAFLGQILSFVEENITEISLRRARNYAVNMKIHHTERQRQIAQRWITMIENAAPTLAANTPQHELLERIDYEPFGGGAMKHDIDHSKPQKLVLKDMLELALLDLIERGSSAGPEAYLMFPPPFVEFLSVPTLYGRFGFRHCDASTQGSFAHELSQVLGGEGEGREYCVSLIHFTLKNLGLGNH